MNEQADPVLAQRARIARIVLLGKRVGWALLLVGVAGFVAGFATGFPRPLTLLVTAALAGTTVVLAPAIVFGYAVKAAEREDRERAG